jgi:hypothetical protein
MIMTVRLTTFALAFLATLGPSRAGELAPGNGHSIALAGFEGVVYYSVEQDGYKVVATLASGPGSESIRFIATLGHGQRVIVSAPRAAAELPLEFEIFRNGDAIYVSDPAAVARVDVFGEAPTPVAVRK